MRSLRPPRRETPMRLRNKQSTERNLPPVGRTARSYFGNTYLSPSRTSWAPRDIDGWQGRDGQRIGADEQRAFPCFREVKLSRFGPGIDHSGANARYSRRMLRRDHHDLLAANWAYARRF